MFRHCFKCFYVDYLILSSQQPYDVGSITIPDERSSTLPIITYIGSGRGRLLTQAGPPQNDASPDGIQ